MVFEAVVSSQLNKFLGAYIENLNSSQLKLGLLGGDVVLNRLVLKQSALDELDLPVKTVAGHIDELVLKIPWTNIYAARTQVCIKGLYLLAIPNQAVAYDAEKERTASKEAKERQLALIEEAKARETAIGNTQENDGFVAKLAAQILQNLLVTVEDVHIRFEDNITNPHHPFAFGMTMKKLALESTDGKWVPTLISEPSKQFYKLLSLECLSVYWLSNITQLLSKMNNAEQVEHFRKGIANANARPYGDSYVAGPITSYAKLRINTRPELDGSNYTIPKIFVNLTMEEISMGLTPNQYNDIVGFLGNIERLNRGSPYRKYRPVVIGYKKYAKYWWLFAYQCVLEENVRRRRRNWRWSHMKEHKDMVRQYIEFYKTKLWQKKEDLKLKKNLEELENRLDVFNITLARRQAEVKIERMRVNEQKIKEDAEAQQKSRGWFGGWFGSGASSAAVSPEAESVVKSLQAEMTPAEKTKLYNAIGYEENAIPANFPKTFVENRFEFFLEKLVILLHDNTNKEQPVILLSSLSRVEATVEQRPAAQALKATVRIGDFVIDGTPQDKNIPSLARPLEANKEILTLVYETNPLDESCDKRIRLAAEPLLITYDVTTLRKISAMFESKEASQLTQLTAVARQKLEDLKKTSALGLDYAIRNHAVIDVDVNIKGSYLVLPFGGCLKNNSSSILCNMGNFSLKSVDSRKRNDESKVSQLMRVGSTEQDILEEMLKSSYDKFSLGLRDVQVISVLPNEEWIDLVRDTNADFFILKPMSIELIVEKCLLLDDPRLPKLKVSGQIPLIHIDVLDTRLVNFAAVLKSIPSPTPENVSLEVVASVVTEVELPTHTSRDDSAFEHLEEIFKIASNKDSLQDLTDNEAGKPGIEEHELFQPTELMLQFEFQDVRLSLSVAHHNHLTKPVLSFGMKNLALVCTKKTFETVVNLTLKDLILEFVDHLAKDGQQKDVKIINSCESSKELLCVRFVDVDKHSPEFRIRHKSVARKLEVVISRLDCDFHQEAVIDLLQLSTDINSRIDDIISVESTQLINPADALKNQSVKVLVTEAAKWRGKEKRRPTTSTEIVDFQLKAQFDDFRVNLLTRKLRLTKIKIRGLEIETAVRASNIVFEAGLDNFRIANPNSNTLYREVVSVVDGRAIQLMVKIFNNATEDINYVDMNKVDLAIHLKMSRMKAVYLSSFVRDLLAFVNHFQAAKEALIEASSAAATAARENVQKVYDKATRILLDIEFQAPYIIVPQRSNSTDALIIDLGHFTLKNRFDLRNVRNEIGSPAIMDSISLNLQELRIFLAVVDGMKVKSERGLIEPLSFNLDLVRNLTNSWYNEEPDLRVDVELGKVSIVVSELVYRKLMQIVFDNLEEGQNQLTETVEHEMKNRESSRPTSAVQGKEIYGENPLLCSQSSELSVDSILQQLGPTRVKMAFSVKLAEIKMELFTNNAPRKEMTFATTLERPLSKLAILGFNVSGQLISDLSIRSTVSLHSFLIEDTRPLLQSSAISSPMTPGTPNSTSKRLVERPINRLLYPTEFGSNPQQQMLLIDFQQERQQDSKVDVHLCGFTLILCPSYLLRLLSFFTAGLPKPKSSSSTKPTVKPSHSSHVAPARSKIPQFVPLITVSVRVDQPDIFLVDRIDRLDTSALVLNFEMNLNLLLLPQAMDISGEVSKLHIYSCLFDPAHRRGTMATVLSPCWLAVKAKLCEDEPASQASQVDVNIGDVTLSVSPGTIALLASVSKSMALTDDDGSSQGEEEEEEEYKRDMASSLESLWEMKPLAFFNFPFLETEVGVEAHELVQLDNFPSTPETHGKRCRSEEMIVVFNHFEMMIETGQGNRTSPLVLVESKMNASVKNWSSLLELTASLNLQAGYYNSRLALWEPLLEPVDCTRLGPVRQRPWELTMKMKKVVEDFSDGFEFENRPSSKLEIKFESADTMELTVTRSFLDVVSLLGKAFSDAVNQKLSKRDLLPPSLYMVHNQLDKNVLISLYNSDFTVDDGSITDAKELILESGSKIGLKLKAKTRTRSVLSEETENERMLTVKIPDLSYSNGIPVSRSSRRYLPAGRSARDENIGIVADICNDFGFRSITFRGVVQIHNHFQQPIDVYYMTKTGNEVNGVGRVEECGVLNVPLFALYTPTGELFFSPLGYGVSIVPFVWRDLQRQNTINKVLQCSSRQSSGTSHNEDPFFMQVTGNVEHIYLEDTKKKTLNSFCYAIHLRPTVILHNSLPLPLYILTVGAVKELIVPPGASRYLSSVEPGAAFVVLKLKNYLERDWACKEEIRPMPVELSVWSLISYDGSAKATLDLGIFSTVKDQTVHMTVYCPFWMINNTGLLLAYKHSGKSSKKAKVRKSLKGEEDNCIYHPENMQDPVLFSFRPKSFFEKKTAMIRVEDSNWSDRFSLDVAGSSGLVTCKTEEEDGGNPLCYQLGCTIQLSHEGLTKQVIFTPYYIISNLAPFDIEVYEVREVGPRSSTPTTCRDWLSVTSSQSLPFWPHFQQKYFIFRVSGTLEETLALSLDNPQPTLLRLNNGYGGLFIDFQISESSVVIVCHPYEDGRAPLLLVNHSQISVSISESNDGSTCMELAPHQAAYYTWLQPNGARNLTWGSCGFKREFSGRDVTRSASGTFDSPAGSLEWICFLHGRQRVLLFTDDKMLAIQQRSVSTAEPVEQSVTVSLHGLGVSLVDNVHRREILYAGITSSGIIWETAKMNMMRPIYRAMIIRHNIMLEEAYQQYMRNLSANIPTSSRRELDGGRLLVDFKELKVYKPKERLLRRSYRSGVELLFETYCNRRLIHARLNKLQIDNQLEDCVFPVVFAPVPPPRSIATESIPHPFVEISVVELLGQQTDVKQYEYFKLLVQECHFRVDMSLINGVGSLFANESDLVSELEHKNNVELDILSAKQGLHERTRLLNDKAPENYFKMLHLSPLKIHLSFSNTGTDGAVSSSAQQSSNNPTSQLLNLLLQSVGVSLTEVQDVVFRLGFFERNDTFLSWQQLARDLQWHYTGQAAKQFYVLVFGLDVIGNPFGLALGISQGVEQLFYEPFQGAIQGPGEFVEGLALGARSLVGHTIGGLAGAGSRIAGTIGKSLSYLTFDKDYQKTRREDLLRRPTDIGENLALGSKGLFMGVMEGVSGVVMRPIEGAQQQGVGGFFAGIGKGMVGLVARPTAAIADFASGSLDAMKKAADVNEELSRLRPPRFLHPDGIVRPYIRYQADGDCLLKILDKGRFSKTDYYVDHAVTDTKATLLVTDRRLVLMSHDLFGQWQVEWNHTWDELTQPPLANPQGLYIPLRNNKKVLGLFTSSESGKLVIIQSQEKCEMIRRKVENIMKS